MSTHSYDVVANGEAGQARISAAPSHLPRVVISRHGAPPGAGLLGARVRPVPPSRDVATDVEISRAVRRERVEAVSVLGDVMRIVRAEPSALRTQLQLEVQLPVPDVAVNAESMRLAILALLLHALDESAKQDNASGSVRVSLRPAGEVVEIAIHRTAPYSAMDHDEPSLSVARFEAMSNGGALSRTESAEGEICVVTRWPAAM